jgi:hypothetical protein
MSLNNKQIWNTIKFGRYYLEALIRFPNYLPQKITYKRFSDWIGQFERKDRISILQLLRKVIYITEKQTASLLIELNSDLLNKLNEDDISPRNIIYIQMHDPGSSSPVMLNMLRDRGRLERKGSYFIDWKNVQEFSATTSELGQGAIIYVDDFSGSGHQFETVRDYLSQFIIGTFAEFFLLPCICEEALLKLDEKGVQPVTHRILLKSDRPLHPESKIIDDSIKQRLTEICRKIDKNGALGYKGLAAMVVYYRNSPNSLPVIFRGCVGQKPWVGILPRTTDLPSL